MLKVSSQLKSYYVNDCYRRTFDYAEHLSTPLSERAFDAMIAALNKYYQSNKFIHVLSDEELTAIPEEVFLCLLSTYIDDVWDRLPHAIKMDKKMRGFPHCPDHYNNVGPTTFD